MTEPLNPNRVVAHNLHAERRARDWTVEEVSSRLSDYGIVWEKATYYAAEASRDPEKAARRFSADEILAIALIFGRPAAWFLTPPEGISMALGEQQLYLRDLLELGLQRDLPDLRPLAERLRAVATAIETYEEARQPESGAEVIARNAGMGGGIDEETLEKIRRSEEDEELLNQIPVMEESDAQKGTT